MVRLSKVISSSISHENPGAIKYRRSRRICKCQKKCFMEGSDMDEVLQSGLPWKCSQSWESMIFMECGPKTKLPQRMTSTDTGTSCGLQKLTS